MLRCSPLGAAVTTTAEPRERRIRRLRLTLHSNDSGDDVRTGGTDTVEMVSDRKTSGWEKRERPLGAEVPSQSLVASEEQEKPPHTPGQAMPMELSATQLKEEMIYIREVRDSLEKVRQRMYGQFEGMQETMQKLSRDIRAAKSRRRSQEAALRSRTAAMDCLDHMNGSLMSSSIDLQKSLLERCEERMEIKAELKSLHISNEQTQVRLQETEKLLASALSENQTLRLEVESSQQASCRALQDLTQRLQAGYNTQLCELQQKHRQETERLQEKLDECFRRIEDAERSARAAEAKIAERDQRISEVERLLTCMGKEKILLEKRLQECEEHLHRVEAKHVDTAAAMSSRQLEEEMCELRERIKHLNDMVFSQQRKVKGLIEEVETLKASVAQKDEYITQLLDRMAFVECENNELEDKLKYFMSLQNGAGNKVESREVGVACDFPIRHEAQPCGSHARVTSYTAQYHSSTAQHRLPSCNRHPLSTCSRLYTPYMRLMEMSSASKQK